VNGTTMYPPGAHDISSAGSWVPTPEAVRPGMDAIQATATRDVVG